MVGGLLPLDPVYDRVRGDRLTDSDSLFLRAVPETALANGVARRDSCDRAVVDRNPGIRLVRGQLREIQRALWQRRDRHRAADLDVRAVRDRAFRLRVQRGI